MNGYVAALRSGWQNESNLCKAVFMFKLIQSMCPYILVDLVGFPTSNSHDNALDLFHTQPDGTAEPKPGFGTSGLFLL